MKCTRCSSENPEGAQFCRQCGNRFVFSCTRCNNPFPPGSRFCSTCGHDLRKPYRNPPSHLIKPQLYTPKFLADKILSRRSVIEGERKIVTVLFADLADSTRIFAKLDPEEVHDIMDGCFRIMMDAVHSYEGTINQFTGDGIMALFGAPIAHEDDAQRAGFAALEMQKALISYGNMIEERYGFPFKMRIGLNSGPVVVASIGDDLRMDYTADGDTVNLASRIESLAKPSTILVSDHVYQRLRHTFRLRHLGRFKVRGKDEPQDIYLLLGKSYGSQRRHPRMIHPDFVNRQTELDILERHVLHAKHGQGSIVSIIGEAGVGKSRLLAELKNKDIVRNLPILEGKALPMGKNLSFHPIIDILKQWANIHEDETEVQAARKLEIRIREIHPEQADEIFPFVAVMMGRTVYGKHAERLKGIEGEALEKLMQKNLVDLIIRASENTPLIFIIDDLHWADASSIGLLTAIIRSARNHRILFITLFRPHFKDTGDRFIQSVRDNYPEMNTELNLQPFDRTHSYLFIENLLKVRSLSRDLINLIHQRTHGNPFFIEEVVRSFLDKGIVPFRSETSMVSQETESCLIPDTVQELLMSRIDRLDEQAKSLLKTASVIGRKFPHRILADVSDKMENLEKVIQYLERVQLIRQVEGTREVEYSFRHPLIQETAYDSILRKNRKEIHLRVAESIERNFPERLHEFYGMIAYHFSRAEELERAEEYLIKAGREALRAAASSEALNYYKEASLTYQRGCPHGGDPEKVATFDRNIALALYNKGQYEEAVEYFDKSLEYHWGRSPKHAFSRRLMFLSAVIHFLISLYVPSLKFRRIASENDRLAVDLFYRKCEALSLINPRQWFLESFFFFRRFTVFRPATVDNAAVILASASSMFSFSGISFKLSSKILDRSRRDMPSEENIKSEIIYQILQTIHNYLRGNWKEIRNYDDDLVNRGLHVGEVDHASLLLYWHGYPSIYRGLFDLANSSIHRLEEIFNQYQNTISNSLKYELKVTFLLEARRLQEALSEVEAGIDFVKRAGSGYVSIEMYSCRALILLFLGDLDKAEDALRYADEVKEEVYSPVPTHVSSYYRTRLEYDLYRFEECLGHELHERSTPFRKRAWKSVRQLLRISNKTAQHRVEAYRLTGIFYWLIEKERKALRWWRSALREGERLGAQLQISRVNFEIGKRLLESRSKHPVLSRIKAVEYLNQARTYMEDADLKWDLDKMRRLTLP